MPAAVPLLRAGSSPHPGHALPFAEGTFLTPCSPGQGQLRGQGLLHPSTTYRICAPRCLGFLLSFILLWCQRESSLSEPVLLPSATEGFVPALTPRSISGVQVGWLRVNRHTFLPRASAAFPQPAPPAPAFRLKGNSGLQGNVKGNLPQLQNCLRH